MHNTIFCPSSHLILNALRCPQCGWQRPPAAAAGERLWGPIELSAGLGGPGRGVFARPAVLQGVAAFPCNNGEVVGVTLADGRERWKLTLEAGQMIRDIVADKPGFAELPGQAEAARQFLACISDERPIDQEPGPGRLAAIEPLKGGVSTLWTASSHQLTPPTLTGQAILLRTSAGEILALQNRPPYTPLWQQKLNAWWPLAPFVAGERVLVSDGRAMHNEAHLLALALADGTAVWEQPSDGMLTHPPAVVQGLLIYQDGRKHVVARSLLNGQKVWRNEYARIYGRPAAGADSVYLAVRGQAPEGQVGHYILLYLTAKDGQKVWQASLPAEARPRSGLLLFEGQLLLGSDDGRILSCSAKDGQVLWEHSLGSPYDPPRTELVVSGGVLVAGSSSGLATAIQVAQAPEEPCDPRDYMQRGDFELAANALALCGDFRQAAKIYAQQLKQIPKALTLLEAGGHIGEAGQLAQAHGLFSSAEDFFRKAGDLPNTAEMVLKKGDLLGAARLFEQANEPKKAAELFKLGGQQREALRLYRQLNDMASLKELLGQMDPELSDIDYLRQHGQEAQAAGLALKHGHYRLAVDIFDQLQDLANEIQALTLLAQSEPTATWAWERLSALARQSGNYPLEAEAWRKLEQETKAAEAYYNAARQMVQRDPKNEKGIADLFEKASRLFQNEGLETRHEECHAMVIQYRHLPQVVISGQSQQAFREGEFNTLDLIIHNVGKGLAQDIAVRPAGDRFEVDETTTIVRIERLAPGVQINKRLFIRPQENQIGESVPLVLEWSWRDRFENEYRERSSTPVAVKRKGESPTGGTPVVIHAQTYVQGTLTQVSGDQIAEGGQKGSRMEIHHGEKSTQSSAQQQRSTAPAAPSRPCPNCSLPVGEDLEFCQGCGQAIKTQ